MPVFDEKGKQIITDEEFPKMKDPEEAESSYNKPSRKSFPLLPAALGLIALILAVVAIIYMVKANTLEQEVAILKKSKAQLATTEVKLQEIMKENHKARADITQVKSELDALKAKNQALEDQLAKKKTAEAQPKKAAKKPAPKKTPSKRP